MTKPTIVAVRPAKTRISPYVEAANMLRLAYEILIVSVLYHCPFMFGY